jgi:hypothetical protein
MILVYRRLPDVLEQAERWLKIHRKRMERLKANQRR